MAQRRNRTTGLATGYRPPSGRGGRRWFGRGISLGGLRFNLITVVAVLGVVVIAISLYLLIGVTVQRPGKTVLEVGESDVKLGYLSRRLEFLLRTQGANLSAATAPNQALGQIQQEELLIQGAAAESVLVNEFEIKNVIARRLGLPENQFDEAFDDAFAAEIDASGMREGDYMRLAQAIAVSEKYEREVLQTPTSGEVVDLDIIATTAEQEALDAIASMGAGESFEDVSAEVSLRDIDTYSETPTTLLPPILETSVAEATVGEVVGPILVDRLYYVVRLNERLEDQEFTPEQRQQMTTEAFSEWLQQQQTKFPIRRDFSSEDAQWALDQVDTS
jgi:hypothetical protein